KVGVESERDKVPGNVFGLHLGPGEPPGSVRGARPSGARQGTAIRGREDDERLVLGARLPPRFGDVGKPGDLAPRALAWLRLDRGQQPVEIAGRDLGRGVVTSRERGGRA